MWEPLNPQDLGAYGHPPEASDELNPDELESYESLAIERSNQVIGEIEKAVAAWNASKEQPEDLALRVERLRYLHQALTGWERKALTARKGSTQKRMELLREFCYIFYRYG